MRDFLCGLLSRGVTERLGADGFALLAFLACHEQPVTMSRADIAKRVGLAKRTVGDLVRRAAEAGFVTTTPGSGRAPERIEVVGITPTESRTTTTISTGNSSGDVVTFPAPLSPPKPAEIADTVAEAPKRPDNASRTLFDLEVETTVVRSAGGKRRARPVEPTVPEVLDTVAFRSKWAEWVKYRSERKKSVTPTTVRLQLANLAKYGVEAAIWAIDVSMCNGWQGLFPEKFNEQGSHNGTRANATTRAGRVVRGRRVDDY